VGKQAAQRFDRQRFNLRKLNEPEVREQYQVEITNRFAALENSDDDEDVNRTWENIKENIQTSAKIFMSKLHTFLLLKLLKNNSIKLLF